MKNLEDITQLTQKHGINIMISQNIIVGTINRVNLGLSKDGTWFRESNGNIILVEKNSYMLSLFPCLEIPKDDFFKWLDINLKLNGIDSKASAFFPTNELILSALKSKSEHWINCALNWLNDNNISAEIYEALFAISQSGKSINQPIRHHALKIYSRKNK